MTKSIVTGPTDTAFSGSTTLAVPIPGLNWTADFRMLPSSPGEVVATNVTTPVDQPETVRFSQRAKANIYQGTNIDPTAYLPVKNGTSTLLELRQTLVETDSGDASYRKLIPVRAAITLDIPSYGNVTAAMVLSLVQRAVALAFEKGVVTSTGLSAIQRGVLKKVDLT